MDLLHEIQLLRNDMNKNHSELSVKVDSNTVNLKTVQLSLSNLTGLLARVEKFKDTIAHLLSNNTQLEAENMLLKQKMSSLERRQLQNNIILSGLPEEPWEDFKKLKSKVIETISCTFPDYSKEEAIRKANSFTMTYSRIISTYEVNKQDQ